MSAANYNNRIPLFSEDFPVILLWSEKAGCTTLVKWFFYQLGLLDEALEYSSWIHDYENSVFKAQRQYMDNLNRAVLEGKKPIYKLVRDPYARAVSSYLSLLEKPEDTERHWSIIERRNIRKFIYGDANVPFSFSFSQYVAWLSDSGIATKNGHIAPQFHPTEIELGNIEIIKVEDFDDEIMKLEESYSLHDSGSEKLAASDHHVKKKQFDKTYNYSFSTLQIPIPRPSWYTIPDVSNMYTEECTNIISSLYSDDFEKYGYQK